MTSTYSLFTAPTFKTWYWDSWNDERPDYMDSHPEWDVLFDHMIKWDSKKRLTVPSNYTDIGNVDKASMLVSEMALLRLWLHERSGRPGTSRRSLFTETELDTTPYLREAYQAGKEVWPDL